MLNTRTFAAMAAVMVLTVFTIPAEVRAQVAADGFSGIVYEDVDSSGSWEPAVDSPLPGWFVYADLNGNRTRQTLEPYAVTGNDGAYFIAVRPGRYSARIEITGGWAALRPSTGVAEVVVASTASGGGIDDLVLPAPPGREGIPEFAVTEGVHFGVFRPASVGDLVWMDRDGDGRQSVEEPGVQGVVVRLLAASTSAVLAITVTDASGRWIFEGLFPGSYRAQIFAPGGFRVTESHAGPDDADSDFDPASGLASVFVLAAGQAMIDLDAGLVRQAFIRFDSSASQALEGPATSVLIPVRLELPSGAALLAPVVVTISDELSGTATAGDDYALLGATLTFPAGATNGTVIALSVQVVDDGVIEGVESVSLRLAVLTGPAQFSTPLRHEVLLGDDDGRGFTVTVPPGVSTDENGGQASFAVVLDAIPRSTVSIQVRSSDSGEGVVSPATLTFSAVTWNQPQTVTVTGIDDSEFDGTATYTVVLDPATSEDVAWSVLQPVNLPFVNHDNEVRISGRLWQDRDPSNDVLDDTDGPLSAWPVRVEDGLGSIVQASQTDASGAYGFILPGGGNYRVVFPPELGYVRQDTGIDDTIDSDVDDRGAMDLSLIDGGEARHIDAGITADHGWEIAVRVFFDRDRDGIRDPGEGAFPGVNISLVAIDGPTVFSQVSSDTETPVLRFVRLHEAALGSYRFAATAPSGFLFTTAFQGADRTVDSDIDPGSGLGPSFRLDFPGCCTHSVSGMDVGLQSVEFSLSVTVSGDGSGRITSEPAGISCTETCAAGFASGTLTELTAIPDPGSVFAGWSGECPGSSTCSLLMNRTRAVTAFFVNSTSPLPFIQRWMVLLAVGGDARRFRIDICEDEGPWLQAPLAATPMIDRALESGWGSSATSPGCSDDHVVVRVVDEGLGILFTKEVSLPRGVRSPRLLVVSGVARPRAWPDQVPGGRPPDAWVLPMDGAVPMLHLIYDVSDAGMAALSQGSPVLLEPSEGAVPARGFGSAQATDPTLETVLITSLGSDTTVFVGSHPTAKVLVAHGFAGPMTWERGVAVDGLDSLGTIESLTRGGRISGRVFRDLDRSGIREWNEPGIAGIPIDVYRDGVIGGSTESDDAGRWVLALAPGAYLVEADTGAEGGAATPIPITLATDGHAADVDFAVAQVSSVSTEESTELPLRAAIDSVFPNPFERRLSLTMRLPEPTRVSASLYDMVGRRTEVLAPSMLAAGSQQVTMTPEPLAAGVYLLVVRAGPWTFSRSIVRVQ